MAMTVTATMAGSPANGVLFRVNVLTGARAAASQPGGTKSSTGVTTNSVSVTTTVTKSFIYGAMTADNSFNAVTGTTLIDNFGDITNAKVIDKCCSSNSVER